MKWSLSGTGVAFIEGRMRDYSEFVQTGHRRSFLAPSSTLEQLTHGVWAASLWRW